MKTVRGRWPENEAGEEKIYSKLASLLPANTPLRAYRARISSDGENFAAAQKACPAFICQKRIHMIRISTNINPARNDKALRPYKSHAIRIMVVDGMSIYICGLSLENFGEILELQGTAIRKYRSIRIG